MPVTFQVVGNLADFGNDPREGVKVRATATPGVKVGDVAVHSNEPETVVTDAAGAFTLELISVVGVWYTIRTPYSNAMNTVRLAGYIPDVDDPTTGVVFPPGTVISLRDVMDEDPTPGYEGLVYSGPPNVLTIGTVTTGAPGSDADADIGGVSPSQTLDLVIPRGDVGPKGDTGGTGDVGPKGDKGDKGDTGDVGPKGDTGDDSTVPGPPNVLAVGTVTTGAAGTSAAATITGASPVQTLNLTIPRGNTGSPTEFELRGTGSPEGVVTAAVGTYYIDTAITNGAMRWAKKTGTGNTGWKVTEGDTGWRSLIDGSRQLLDNISGWRIDVGGANRSLLRIRRVNDFTLINGWELWVPNAGDGKKVWGTTEPERGGITLIPAGFRGKIAVGWSAQPSLATWNGGSYQVHNMLSSVFPTYGNTSLQGWPNANVLTVGPPTNTALVNSANWQVSLNIMFSTDDGWPTSLPGTAA